MKGKSFVLCALSLTLVPALLLAAPTYIVDPFFHYHAPVEGVSYLLENERYQNDGILRNFEYDAIITGSSMSQNFKTSEFDRLFGTKSVKVPFAGGYYKEICDRLRTAYNSSNDIHMVILSLDLFAILADKSAISTYDYPEYLYDRNPLNDTYYLFNKEVLIDYTIGNIKLTKAGKESTPFDDYSYWSEKCAYGIDAMLGSYVRPPIEEEKAVLTDVMWQSIYDNLTENIISLAKEHPETEFICFVPPYSIIKLDSWNRKNNMEYCFEIYKKTAELLLGQDNIRVFSFYDEHSIICNPDNYRDDTHYGGWVNTYMLESIKEGRHELTPYNCAEHFDSLLEYYSNYDYDIFFK